MRPFIIFFLLVICCCSGSAFAQDSTVSKDFRFKSHSIQFQINDMFRISDFQGSLISYKYHFNNNLAIRFGLGFSTNTSDGDDYRENLVTDTTGSSFYGQSNNMDKSSIDIILKSQFLYYFNPNQNVKLYAGLGPYFTSTIRDNDYRITQYDDNSENLEIQKNDQDYFKAGLSASYGLEWFFTEDISLLAEYGFLYYYYERITKTRINETRQLQETNYRKTKEDGWIFDTSVVKLGLSIYF